MTCTGYDPVWKKQAGTGPYQWSNCGPCATAEGIDDATCGAKKPDPEKIRSLMRDTAGGTNLGQADQVANVYYGVDFDVRYRLSWSQYESMRQSGKGAYLQVGYRPIRDSRFRGSETFVQNHALYDPPSGRTRDSLADGRRDGIYRFANEVYPRELLKRAAGMLNLAPAGKPPVLLGYGLVYVGFTRDNDAQAATYAVTMGAGPLDWWRVVDGKADRYIRGASTAGFTRRCTAPKRYPWPGHTKDGMQLYVSLVRILDGPHAGKSLALNSPRLTLKET